MAHFTQEDYAILQERLNTRLSTLAEELTGTLKHYEKDSRKFEKLKIGWEFVVEWLESAQRWPEIDTYEDLNSKTCRKVLYVNLNDFAKLTSAQLSQYPYIVLKDGFPQALLGSHLAALKEAFEFQPNGVLNIQSYLSGGKGPVWDERAANVAAERLADMLKHMEDGTSQPFIRESDKGWNHRLPWNFLNLDGSALDPVTSPASVHPCLRLLYSLCEELKQRAAGQPFGKLYDLPASAAYFADVQSCLRFLILGEKGTFSGNHVDILAGTWILGLSGLKLWWAFTGNWTDDRKAAFIQESAGWNPGPGLMQLLPIEPGDYMMMMPGHLCAHAPFSMDNCLMTGGMFWNDHMLPQLLDNISWICENNGRVSNEGVPRQLIHVLSLLDSRPSLPNQHRDTILRTKQHLHPLLSCACKDSGGCTNQCACAHPTGIVGESSRDQIWWRSSGCTDWCDCDCKTHGRNHGTIKAEVPLKATKKKRGRPKGQTSAKRVGPSGSKKGKLSPRSSEQDVLPSVPTNPASPSTKLEESQGIGSDGPRYTSVPPPKLREFQGGGYHRSSSVPLH
jgi:hypothetical protein